MNTRHPLASLIPPVSPDDIASATWHLRFVVDAGLQALLLLDPDISTWDVPVGALDQVVEQHPGYVRGRRRVADLVARAREHLPDVHHPDLAELEEHVRTAMTDASEAGWRLGLLMSRAGGAGT
jgi:hypothetical protein